MYENEVGSGGASLYPITQDAEAGGFLWVLGQPCPHSKFQDSRVFIKKSMSQNNNKHMYRTSFFKGWGFHL